MHPTCQWRAYRGCPDAQASPQVQGNGSLSLFVCVCVCGVAWFSCSKPIAWPWSQRWVVCMNACECERPSLQDYFCSPQTRKGGPRWMRSSCLICTHTHKKLPQMHTNTPTKAHVQRAHTPTQWFNLMMGIGGETGICEGQKSLNSKNHHCRLLLLSLLLHCHYCWPASSHYQLTSSNTLHYQFVLNRQMGWTLQQMTE